MRLLRRRIQSESPLIVACEWDSLAREVIQRCAARARPEGGAIILIRRDDQAIYSLNATESPLEGLPAVTKDDCGETSTMGQVWDTLQNLSRQQWALPAGRPPIEKVTVCDMEFSLV